MVLIACPNGLQAQTVSIDTIPPKLPKGTALGRYSPPIEFGYSGLAQKQYKLKVWLLDDATNFLGSAEWGPREMGIDNTSGNNASGTVSVVANMSVYSYSKFKWVARLYSVSGTTLTEVANDLKTVNATTNRPPLLNTIGNRIVPTGGALRFTVAAGDADGGTPLLTANNLPSGAVFDPSSGTFAWTPTSPGVHTGLRFLATDQGDGPLTDAEEITVTVTDQPLITAQPQPLILEPGQSGSLTVVATANSSAGAISYQWSKDNSARTGQQSATLALQNVTAGNAGTYRVNVSSSKGTSTSDDVFVIVTAPRTNDETRRRLIDYLRGAQDEFHQTIDVYRDLDSPGNHFHARGYIPDQHALVTTVGDWTINPRSGATCMKFTFQRDSTGRNGGGIYLMNGALINGSPLPYFGEQQLQIPNNQGGMDTIAFVDSSAVASSANRSFHGMDLTGATKLVFYARGEDGGEAIEFFVGGVGRPPYAQQHPDSMAREPVAGTLTTLNKTWTRYEIDLTGKDLSDIKGALGWYAEAKHNARALTTFYLDDVYFELSPSAQAARLAQPRFMRSFRTLDVQPSWTPGGDIPFDLAFRSTASIYDQVVALFAFLSSEEADGPRRAKIIADALVYTIHHHRNPMMVGKTRLRGYSRLYKAGDVGLPPGWEINGLAATVPAAGVYHDASKTYTELAESDTLDTGENLWCVMGLLAVYEATHEAPYLQSALIAAQEVHEQRQDTGTYQGFLAGIQAISSPAPTQRTYRSLEHNLDAVAAFRRLYAFTGDAQWLDDANHALVFVEQMWRADLGCYLTGTTGGSNPQPNDAPDQLPEDAQSWTTLAIPEVLQNHPLILNSVETYHKVHVSGMDAFKFTTAGNGFWPESQGHISCAYYRAGNRQRSADIASLLPKLQQMPAP